MREDNIIIVYVKLNGGAVITSTTTAADLRYMRLIVALIELKSPRLMCHPTDCHDLTWMTKHESKGVRMPSVNISASTSSLSKHHSHCTAAALMVLGLGRGVNVFGSFTRYTTLKRTLCSAAISSTIVKASPPLSTDSSNFYVLQYAFK